MNYSFDRKKQKSRKQLDRNTLETFSIEERQYAENQFKKIYAGTITINYRGDVKVDNINGSSEKD